MSSGEQLGVKAFVSPGNDEFLFLLRAYSLPGERQPGWDIPGGRIKTNFDTFERENPIDAVRRETREETDIELLEPFRFVETQEFEIEEAWLTVRRTYFQANCLPNPVIKLRPKEHTDFCWSTIERAIGGLQLNPVLREFLIVSSGNISRVPTRP